VFTNETETREKIELKMSLVREIIILDCRSHESGNLLESILWIPVFTGMTNERQNLNESINFLWEY
jgi:hypothetical protein